MGMDVYGKSPTSPVGEYFRNNVWWWRPLWCYCEHVATELIPSDNLGHSNDGWGLDADGARQLAAILEREIASGATALHDLAYNAANAALPDEPCSICGGTGQRAEPPHIGPGATPCNGCNATGKTRPFQTWYPFSVDNVKEFAAFLAASGGFEIC